MRKKFILYVLIPLVILGVVVYLFIDRWVESGLELAGESIVGARVEIDGLALSLFPLGIEFERMQVANPDDPWKNIFETRRVAFSMDAGQLLRGKYIIETMEVNHLILGTKRTTDGTLPGGRPERAKDAGDGRSFTALAEDVLSRSVEKTPIFDPAMLRKGINIDSLLAAVDLQTLKHIDTLKARAATATAQWQSTLADVDATKQRLAVMDSSIRAINPSALKDVPSIMAAIKTVDDTRTGINDIVSTYNTRRDAITGEIRQIGTAVGAIDDLAKADYQRVLSLARLPDINAIGMAEALVGPQLVSDVRTYLGYVDMAREKIRNYTPEPEMEKPPRMEGQDIHFPVERHYPKFWVKNVAVSGGEDITQDEDAFLATGTVKHISSDQRVTGQPMSIDLSATRGKTVRATLAALFDRRKEEPYDRYRATMTGVPLAGFAIGSPDFLPATITGATLNTGLQVEIPGRMFDARTELGFRTMSISYAAPAANIGERLAREVLDGVKGFDVDLRLWNSAEGFKMALATDLDDQFAARVKAVLGAELAKLQAELRAKVNGVIAEKRREFEAVYAAKRAEAEKKLAEYQAIVTEKIAMVDAKKKELEDRLEKEKKGKVDDAVKKLFKRN